MSIFADPKVKFIDRPTSFMKGLSPDEYNAILTDVTNLTIEGNKGLKALKVIIRDSGIVNLKDAFNNYSNPQHGKLFLYDNLKDGYEDLIRDLRNLPPGTNVIDLPTINKVKEVYKDYFEKIEHAGLATFKSGNETKVIKYETVVNNSEASLSTKILSFMFSYLTADPLSALRYCINVC